MHESTSHCRHESNWATDCRVHFEKLGEVVVKSKFNFCTSPAVLDTTVRVHQHVWRLAFSPKNARESKIIGMEHWPLRTTVNFLNEDNTVETVGRRTVLACIEAVKNGEEFCFVNASIPEHYLTGRSSFRPISSSRYYECDSGRTEITKASIPLFTIVCLVLSILLVAAISCLVCWRRRVHRRRVAARYRNGKCAPLRLKPTSYQDGARNHRLDFEEEDEEEEEQGLMANGDGRSQLRPDGSEIKKKDSMVQTSLTSLLEPFGVTTSTSVIVASTEGASRPSEPALVPYASTESTV